MVICRLLLFATTRDNDSYMYMPLFCKTDYALLYPQHMRVYVDSVFYVGEGGGVVGAVLTHDNYKSPFQQKCYTKSEPDGQ